MKYNNASVDVSIDGIHDFFFKLELRVGTYW